jgi:Uma2 family endonuclease
MQTKMSPSLARLERTEGKAELIHGEVVPLMPTGQMPAFAAFEIAVSLRLYVRQENLPGIVVPDNAGFIVDLPNRQSFSPDAAYYEGPRTGMRFFEGAPQFAVEVRSENDYGESAERAMTEKRRDYFFAGTEVVWDVDLLAEGNNPIVRKYVAPNAEEASAVFRRGEIADAEPSVPGWTINTNDLFEG